MNKEICDSLVDQLYLTMHRAIAGYFLMRGGMYLDGSQMTNSQTLDLDEAIHSAAQAVIDAGWRSACVEQQSAIALLEALSGPDWTVKAIALSESTSTMCLNDFAHGLARCRLWHGSELCLTCTIDSIEEDLTTGAHITVEVYK